MSISILGHTIDIWITRYVAAFCLFTILAWAGGAFCYIAKWEQLVRDCLVYLLIIGITTLVLLFRPETNITPLLAALSWFCFAMLLIMELLWISYMMDHLFRALRAAADRARVPERPTGPHIRT